jgi:hypothetical protein
MEACYGGTDVMERSCAVARGIDINTAYYVRAYTRTYIAAKSRTYAVPACARHANTRAACSAFCGCLLPACRSARQGSRCIRILTLTPQAVAYSTRSFC